MIGNGFQKKEKREIATFICGQDTARGAYEYYRLLRPMLQGWRFILSSEHGPQPGYAVNRSFGAGAIVRSPFRGKSVLVLDEVVSEDMARLGRAVYPIDFSISLDTQALSCIQPFLENRVSRLPKDFEEVFMFLSNEEVNCDALPYMIENLRNLRDRNNHDAIYRKLRAYQVLRFIDAPHLRATGEIRATLSEAELNKAAQEMLAFMLHSVEDLPQGQSIRRVHSVLFCVLAKIALIHLGSPRRTVAKKVIELLEFMDQELSCMFLPESLLAYTYFSRGQSLRFFSEVQIKKRNLLAVLNRMAWDLSHIRNIHLLLTSELGQGARYFFPAILTFDQPLKEIFDFYALSGCAIGPASEDVIPVQSHHFGDIVCHNITDSECARLEEFFTEAAIARRESVGNGRNVNTNRVAIDLIERLSAVCSCDFDDKPENFF